MEWVLLIPALVLALLPSFSLSSLNFYIDSDQTELLYGVRTRGIYYIRDGQVNQHAMNFQDQVIPFQVSDLVFHWEATAPPPASVGYSIHTLHAPSRAMDTPILLNANATGHVPDVDSKFAVRFPCTGLETREIDVLIQIKFILPGESKAETLNFQRKKVCLGADSPSSNLDGLGTDTRDIKDTNLMDVYPEDIPDIDIRVEAGTSGNTDTDLGAKVKDNALGPGKPTHSNDPFGIRKEGSYMLALGAALGAVSLLTILLSVLYVTRRKRLPTHNPLGSSTINLRSHEESMAHVSDNTTQRSLGRGSYATLASFTSIPVNAPINGSGRSNRRVKNGSAMTLRDNSAVLSHQRWLDNYNGTQHQHFSNTIWSSHSNQHSSLHRYNQPQHHPMLAQRAASQNSIFGRCPELAPTLKKTPIPQPKALVLENGMLKLRAPNTGASEPQLNTIDIKDKPEPDVTHIKSDLNNEEIPEDNRYLEDTSEAIKQAVNEIQQPFYQNVLLLQNNFLSHENLYSDLPVSEMNNCAEDRTGGNNGCYAMYTPQIYPHLMPQNIVQAAQRRMPRSSSGGSVLV